MNAKFFAHSLHPLNASHEITAQCAYIELSHVSSYYGPAIDGAVYLQQTSAEIITRNNLLALEFSSVWTVPFLGPNNCQSP